MKKTFLTWFFFGLGSQLQIVASLSFMGLFVFIAAPFIFLREKDYMKRNGVFAFTDWHKTEVIHG